MKRLAIPISVMTGPRNRVVRCLYWAAAFLHLLVFLFVICLADHAQANSLETAREAHAEGRFLDAARIAEDLGTPTGFGLAAESLAIHGYFIAAREEHRTLFERASFLAKEAVAVDPANANAYVQVAHATGHLTESIGWIESVQRKHVETIRDAAKNAVRLAPNMAAAHAVVGRWHAGLVGALGPLLARITYGAREREAIISLKRAVELSPRSRVMHLQYALGLLDMDKDRHHESARILLERIPALPAKNALDHLIEKRALDLVRDILESTH